MARKKPLEAAKPADTELTPARAVELAQAQPRTAGYMACDYVPAMLELLAKGWHPGAAAEFLQLKGCKIPSEELQRAVMNKMGRI